MCYNLRFLGNNLKILKYRYQCGTIKDLAKDLRFLKHGY
jgi:hypothetical protein